MMRDAALCGVTGIDSGWCGHDKHAYHVWSKTKQRHKPQPQPQLSSLTSRVSPKLFNSNLRFYHSYHIRRLRKALNQYIILNDDGTHESSIVMWVCQHSKRLQRILY